MPFSTPPLRPSRDSSLETISPSTSSLVILDDSDIDDEEDFVLIPSSPGGSRQQPITLDVDEGDANIDVYLTNNGDTEEDTIDPHGNFLFDDTFDGFEDEPISDASDECIITGSTFTSQTALTEKSRFNSLQDHSSHARSVNATLPSLGSPKRKRVRLTLIASN